MTETLDSLKKKCLTVKADTIQPSMPTLKEKKENIYVWTEDEIRSIKLPEVKNADNYKILSDYFNLDKKGHWEKNNFILLRYDSDEVIASKYNITVDELSKFISESKTILKKKRDERVPPALDTKVMTSWNALQISALCNAYEAFGDEAYNEEALKCANDILRNAIT